MKRLTFILLVLFAGIQSVMAQRFELVTSTSQLESDARYIFVNSKTPGESAQMMSGNSLDLGSIHTIGGTRVTIGQDGIIDLSPSGILGWLGNALTRPEHCIYTLNKSQNGILGIGQKWIAYNYQGKALSTKRDENPSGSLSSILNLMGQAQLVDVTDETEDIQLEISIRDDNDQVYVHSGEISITDILSGLGSLGNIGNIQDNPLAALELVKLLDPLRYLTASNIGAAGINFTSTFTFNVPVDVSVIMDAFTNPSFSSIRNLIDGITTNLYLYKEIEEPTTYELVTDMSQIVSGEDYVILNAKQTTHGKNTNPAYLLSNNKFSTGVDEFITGTNVAYDKFEHQGVYGLDGQSYVDVRPRFNRVYISGDTENGFYISSEGKVLSAMQATGRKIDFTNDSTYARMSIDIAADGVANIYAQGKTTEGSLIKRTYNHLAFYNGLANKSFTFYSDNGDAFALSRNNIYLYRKAKTEKLPTPVITPKSNNGILGIGANPFVDPQTVTITCEQEGAHIYYTLDGSEPTSSSLVYNGPFVVDGPCTVKAIAMYRINKSDVASATYIFKKQAPEYVFSSEDGKVMLAPKTIKEGETISYTVQSKGMNNVTGNFTTDNASVEVTAAPYAGQEFYVTGKTSASGFTTSDTGSGAYTYTDNLHVTASFDFAGLSTGAYNNKAKVERTDNEGWNHTTSASANLTISNGALRIGNNQTFTINATVLPYSTITLATTNKVIINGETITPINGLATWHNENAVKEVTIKTGETTSLTNWNPSSTITSVKVTMPKYVEVTIGSTGYASYCPIYFDVVAPEDLTVYYVDATYADYMHLSEAANTIQMGEGVILNGEPGTYKLWISETPASAISGNFLYGSMEDTYFEQDEVYLLSYKNNILKFRHNTAGTLPAGKAYVKSSDVPNSQSAHEFTMVFGDDATAIESTVADTTTDCEMYNIQGQRVSNSYKGVVIINGNKYLKK